MKEGESTLDSKSLDSKSLEPWGPDSAGIASRRRSLGCNAPYSGWNIPRHFRF